MPGTNALNWWWWRRYYQTTGLGVANPLATPYYYQHPNYYQPYYTTSGTGVTVTDPFWNQTTAATTGTYNRNVWNTWVTATATNAVNAWAQHQVNVNELREHPTERNLLIQRNRSRAHALRQKVAERRAEELLRENLTDEQREEYDRLKHFHVIADGKTYRIRRGWAGNIALIEDGQPVERWCVHPRTSIPVPDSLLSQKLMLECGQADELRSIANVERLRPRPVRAVA